MCPFADTIALCFSPHYPRINDLDIVPIKASFFFCPFVLQCTTLSHAAHIFKYSQSQMLFWECNRRFFMSVSVERSGRELREDNPRFSFPSSLEDNHLVYY